LSPCAVVEIGECLRIQAVERVGEQRGPGAWFDHDRGRRLF